jgi:adenylate cyclase
VLKRLTLILGMSITALAVLLAAAGPPILSQARDLVFDAYQRASPRAYDPAAPVHIIDIDEAALDAYGQWPWPRSYMAALTDRLFDHGAAAVGYDVLFAEPDRTSPERIAESWSRFREGIPPVLPDLGLPPHDQVFAAAIAGRPVVLSVAGGQEGEVPVPLAGVAVTGALPPGLTQFPAAVVNLPDLTAAAAGLGTISLGRTGDGVTRTVPLVSVVGETPDARALGGASARGARGRGARPAHHRRLGRGLGRHGGRRGHAHRRAEFPGGGRRCLPHPFLGRPGPARVTPAARVLEAEGLDPELQARVAGRIVLVGSSAQGLFDIRTTPLDPAIAGVTLHAEIIEQIVAGRSSAARTGCRGWSF